MKTGRDVRAMGSGNIGATNVLRTTSRNARRDSPLLLGHRKGYLAVWAAGRLTGAARRLDERRGLGRHGRTRVPRFS